MRIFPHVAPIPSRERDEQLRESAVSCEAHLQSPGQIADELKEVQNFNWSQNLREKT
jgi:hypothetical protein